MSYQILYCFSLHSYFHHVNPGPYDPMLRLSRGHRHVLWLLFSHRLVSRLLCPWDSPGKNTGVGCHFLLTGDLSDPGMEPAVPALTGGFFTTEPPGKSQIRFCGVCVSRSVVSDSLQSARLLCPWNSPSKNTWGG